MRISDLFERRTDEDLTDDRPPLRCKRCGSTDVRWRMQGGRWTLFSLKPGVEHSCDQASADEFEVED